MCISYNATYNKNCDFYLFMVGSLLHRVLKLDCFGDRIDILSATFVVTEQHFLIVENC
jgi:hypothetical protein